MDKGEAEGLLLLAVAASDATQSSSAASEIGEAELVNNEHAARAAAAVISCLLVQQKHPIPTRLEMHRTKRKTYCIDNNRNAKLIKMPRTKRIRHCSNNHHDGKLMDIPSDILIGIILRLSANSLCLIRCVSKLLKNIVDNPFFVRSHMCRLLTATKAAAQVPQLMLLYKSIVYHRGFGDHIFNFRAVHSLEYDDSGNTLKQRKNAMGSEILTSIREVYSVHFVFCNLLCFKDIKYGGRCFLCNPLKGEVLMLPASNVQVPVYRRGLELFDWYGMGFDNITGTYKILQVSGTPYCENMVAQVLVLGTSTWLEIRSVPHILSYKNVSAYGDMHWMLNNFKIISFDFKKDEFNLTPHPPLQNKNSHNGGVNLLNLRGCLAIVDAWSETHIDIWVLKNYDNKEWEKQYCINTEFARYVKCHGFEMQTGEWEHGIFFKDSIHCHRIENTSTAIFCDLRGSTVSTKPVECPVLVKNWTIISYTGSLISLKDYGNLKQQQQQQLGDYVKLWEID